MQLTDDMKLAIIANKILYSKGFTLLDYPHFEEPFSSIEPVIHSQIWKGSKYLPSNNPLRSSSFVDGDIFTDGDGKLLIQKLHKYKLTPVPGDMNSFYLNGLDNLIPDTFGDGSYSYTIWRKSISGAYTEEIDPTIYEWVIDSSSGVLRFSSPVPIRVSASDPPAITCYRYVGETGNIVIGSSGIPGGQGDQGPIGPTGQINTSRMRYKGEWNSSTTYIINDTVTISNVTYVSLVNSNTNNTPISNPDDWAPITFDISSGTFLAPINVAYVSPIFSNRQHPYYSTISSAITNTQYIYGFDVDTMIYVYPSEYPEDITLRNKCHLYLSNGAVILGSNDYTTSIINFPTDCGKSGIYGNGVIGKNSKTPPPIIYGAKTSIRIGYKNCDINIEADAVYARELTSILVASSNEYDIADMPNVSIKVKRTSGTWGLYNCNVHIEGPTFYSAIMTAGGKAIELVNCNAFVKNVYHVQRVDNPLIYFTPYSGNSLFLKSDMNSQIRGKVWIENCIFGNIAIFETAPGTMKWHINNSYFNKFVAGRETYNAQPLMHIEGYNNTCYDGQAGMLYQTYEIDTWIGEAPNRVPDPPDFYWLNTYYEQ